MNRSKFSIDHKSLFRRFIARLFDYTLLFTVFSFFIDSTNFLELSLLTPLIFMIIETFCIAFSGATPGKFLCGIRIKQTDGKKLSLKQSFQRSFTVWIKGMAFGLPFLNIIVPVIQLIRARKTKSFSWDKKDEIEVLYAKRKVAGVLIAVCLFGVMITPYIVEEEWKNTTLGYNTNIFNLKKKKDGEFDWKKFNPGEEEFAIAFPKDPDFTSREIPVPKSSLIIPFKEYSCTHNKTTSYSVCYIELPQKWLKWGSSLVLKGSLKVLVKMVPNAKIVGKNTKKFKKLPALDFILSSKNHEVMGKLILVGNKLYKIEVKYPAVEREKNSTNLYNFIESFELTKKSSKVVKETSLIEEESSTTASEIATPVEATEKAS